MGSPEFIEKMKALGIKLNLRGNKHVLNNKPTTNLNRAQY